MTKLPIHDLGQNSKIHKFAALKLASIGQFLSPCQQLVTRVTTRSGNDKKKYVLQPPFRKGGEGGRLKQEFEPEHMVDTQQRSQYKQVPQLVYVTTSETFDAII